MDGQPASDDVVLDVGANIGVIATIVAGARKPGVHVDAVEPEPTNARALRANVEANALSNVTVHGVALGETTERRVLRVSGESGTGSHSLLRSAEADSREIEVDVVRGEEFVQSTGRIPGVVKIDVEGAELAVVRGLASVLRAGETHDVFIEIHPGLLPDGASPEAVRGSLREAGFRLAWTARRGDEIHEHHVARDVGHDP